MRIAGVNVPVKKCVPFALTYIYGIGVFKAGIVCDECDIDKKKRISELSEEEGQKISNFIRENYITEGELKKEISSNIKRLIDIGCYRGIRHRKKLPVRGQRTRTNARTRKGRSRMPITGKK